MEGGSLLVLLELLLVFGAVFGFGFWQLWSLRRERKRDRAADGKPEPPDPAP